MTEREAIIFLVENEHQVVQDCTYWIFRCSEMAGDQDGKYIILEEEIGQEKKETLYDSLEEAVDKYLELVKEWRGW